MIRFFLLLFFFVSSAVALFAQKDTTWSAKPSLTFGGFLDAFYAYDFNDPEGNRRQDFFYNHNRQNEFNVNLALISAKVEHARYRANFALQAGTYPNDNYAGEDATIKNIFEANVGIALNRKSTWWLDAGIMPSYIGFESAISIDNPTLTRSILAESSPYFMTGARLSYTISEKWSAAALLTNGWQRIQRVDGNSLPSFGTNLMYESEAGATLNWSTFVGSEYPDSTRRFRYFNNIYGQFGIGERWDLTLGFDVGAEQRSKGSSNYHIWYAPIAIAAYRFSDEWGAALRVEYYSDEHNVIVISAPDLGFQTTGFSINVDYRPVANVACRLEGRSLQSSSPQFRTDAGYSSQDFFLAGSVAVKF